jgi:hypothetical protein
MSDLQLRSGLPGGTGRRQAESRLLAFVDSRDGRHGIETLQLRSWSAMFELIACVLLALAVAGVLVRHAAA